MTNEQKNGLESVLQEIIECECQTNNPTFENVRPFAVDEYGRAVIANEILGRWIVGIRAALGQKVMT